MQLRENHQRIAEKGVSVAAVVPASSGQIQQFTNVFGPYPFLLAGDPKRDLYATLNHKHVSKLKSLSIVAKYLLNGRIKEIFPSDPEQRKVIKDAMFSQDVYQMGGTWLISGEGKILWRYIDHDPTIHPTIAEILKQIDGCSQV